MAPWKYYVYQFFLGDKCVYVGKGSGSRFNCQCRRFREYRGQIVAYFMDEQSALTYERALILELMPQLNKALMPESPKPWLVRLVPERSEDIGAWISAIGSRQVAGRIILSRDWSVIKSYGIDIKSILSKLDPWCEALNGSRP